MHLADRALRLGENLYPEKAHSLVQARDMFLVPAQPVQRLGHQHVEPARHCRLLQGLKSGAQMRRPGDRLVREDLHHLPAALLSEPAADPHLVGDRRRRL